MPTLPAVPWGKYRHYLDKTKIYEVVGLSRHTETLEITVVYKRLDPAPELGEGALWSRPYEMFIGNVDYEGKSLKRFQKVE